MQEASGGGAQRASGANASAQPQAGAGGVGASAGAPPEPRKPQRDNAGRDGGGADAAAQDAADAAAAAAAAAPAAPQPVNPFRSLGDAREQLRRDLLVAADVDDGGAEDEGAGGDADADAPADGPEWRFVRQEDGDAAASAAQVLADATREQAEEQAGAAAAAAAAADDETTMQEDQPLCTDADDEMAAEEDQEGLAEDARDAETGGRDSAGGGVRSGALQTAASAAAKTVHTAADPTADSDLENDTMDVDAPQTGVTEALDGANAAHVRSAASAPGASDAPEDTLVAGLDALLAAERAPAAVADDTAASTDAGTAARGQRLLARCTALTGGLTGELVEQLRLVLEPTTASRMTGDYKTGKRLNMKKVIGYVASNFRQDKIWQRRTKPDARRYQVMLAIDETRSMRVRAWL